MPLALPIWNWQSTDNRLCCIHRQQHTQKPIKIILISRTHLYPRDSWSLPCGLEPFGPALSASPPSFPSPSGPSSFLPGLSSPLPLWPMETISISVWNLNTDFKKKGSYFSQWTMVAYLSIGNVERLSQLGKVFVDVNCLQPPSVSGQTFIKRNGVTLWSTWRERNKQSREKGNESGITMTTGVLKIKYLRRL